MMERLSEKEWKEFGYEKFFALQKQKINYLLQIVLMMGKHLCMRRSHKIMELWDSQMVNQKSI